MDKNTPLSSLSSSENEMEPNGKDITKNQAQTPAPDPTEPSAQVIRNILNYSKAIKVEPSKSPVEFVEYIAN